MIRLATMIFVASLLVGCVDREEKAEQHYLSALELVETGDMTRAMIELRNVLQNDGFHKDGRQLYANLLLDQGDLQAAYRQLLRLVEQYPDTLEARRQLAELAMDTGDWDEVRRHGTAAAQLAPDVPAHRALQVMIDYRNARAAGDQIAAAQHVTQARALLEEDPELDTALRLLVDWLNTGPAPERALPYLDRLLERHPDTLGLHMARLRILDGANRQDEVGAHLRLMNARFPANTEISQFLLRWYVSEGDLTGAEDYLRQRAGPRNGPYPPHLDVVNLVEQARGLPAALAELDQLASENADTDLGRQYALEAALRRFEAGIDQSTEPVEALIGQTVSSDLVNDGRFVLSRMYDHLARPADAAAQLTAILESDPSHVPALVSRGAAFLSDGAPQDAVGFLRQALNQDPRNTDALILLAQAQQRLGNVELAEQRLAQAVEVSGGEERIVIAFARFLNARGNSRAAEQVLTQSVRSDVSRLDAAALLSDLVLSRGDVSSAKLLLADLRQSENPQAAQLARTLQAGILFRENRIEESLDVLRSSLGKKGTNTDELGAELQVLRVLILSQRFEEARTHLGRLRIRFPDSLALRVIEGNMLAFEGRLGDAIELFQRLNADNPAQTSVVQRLYRLLVEANRPADASALLVRALDIQPESPALLLLEALDLERNGEIDAALARYKSLIERVPNNITVANNYASMLAYYTEDEASLVRAKTIARPLNGLNVPAYLDTLGYISLREGNPNAAIVNFEAAVRGLPDNPTLAFNLGLAYEAAGRKDDARAELERGIELARDRIGVLQIDRARAALDALDG